MLNQAKGIYVYDQSGKKYLDANSGLWNSVVGFDHPRMIEVAKKQYEKFSGYHSFFGRISEPAVRLADKLIEISPFSRGKVFLLIRAPRQMTQRLNFYGLSTVERVNLKEEKL